MWLAVIVGAAAAAGGGGREYAADDYAYGDGDVHSYASAAFAPEAQTSYSHAHRGGRPAAPLEAMMPSDPATAMGAGQPMFDPQVAALVTSLGSGTTFPSEPKGPNKEGLPIARPARDPPPHHRDIAPHPRPIARAADLTNYYALSELHYLDLYARCTWLSHSLMGELWGGERAGRAGECRCPPRPARRRLGKLAERKDVVYAFQDGR